MLTAQSRRQLAVFLAVVGIFLLNPLVAAATDFTATAQFQRAGLRALFEATGGTRGLWKVSAGWNSTDSEGSMLSVCGWFGVSCFANGAISAVALGDNGLSGSLPSLIFSKLFGDTLLRFNVSRNQIRGTLSDDVFTSWPSIRLVDLSRNQLRGPLPASLAAATMLKEFSVADNFFTGPLVLPTAAAVPGLTTPMPVQLELLDGSRNYFLGTMPASIGEAALLRVLRLAGNHGLTGAFPESAVFAGLKSLEVFDVSDCDFHGALPASLFGLPRLIYLDVSRNSFEDAVVGPPPASAVVGATDPPVAAGLVFAGDAPLRVLRLADNAFSGPLPLPSAGHAPPLEEALLGGTNRWACPLPVGAAAAWGSAWRDAPPATQCAPPTAAPPPRVNAVAVGPAALLVMAIAATSAMLAPFVWTTLRLYGVRLPRPRWALRRWVLRWVGYQPQAARAFFRQSGTATATVAAASSLSPVAVGAGVVGECETFSDSL